MVFPSTVTLAAHARRGLKILTDEFPVIMITLIQIEVMASLCHCVAGLLLESAFLFLFPLPLGEGLGIEDGPLKNCNMMG